MRNIFGIIKWQAWVLPYSCSFALLAFFSKIHNSAFYLFIYFEGLVVKSLERDLIGND
jgi:hypothetical protein